MAACDLIFEMELEGCDADSTQQLSQRVSSPLVQAIQTLSAPQNVYESQVLRCVREVKRHSRGCGEVETLWRIVEGLHGREYMASLIRSVGCGGDDACFDLLYHSFVEVVVNEWGTCDAWGPCIAHDVVDVTQRCQNTLIVEPALRDAFVIGEQTPRYREVLALVPHEFVGPKDRLAELVRLLCNEMEAAFLAIGRAVPPWRRFRSVTSRWNPTYFQKQAGARSLGPMLAGSRTPLCAQAVGLPVALLHNDGVPVRDVSGFYVGRLASMCDVPSTRVKDPKLRQDTRKAVLARTGSAIRAMC